MVLCGAVLGAGLGFLWFNAPPASIFMGDTGSLALGGMLGTVAVATKHEIALAIIGGLFVLEAVSVIVQVASFKLTGKRVFRMAPAASPFRAEGLDRAADRDPVLDYIDRTRARRPLDVEAAMIPVTTFADKKVALFGLGASGLASASALLAGGADVVAFDDTEASVEKAHAAGIPTEDLRRIDWGKISALVLAPGVPLTHPAPHWTVGLARNAAVEVIGDIELFCRERPPRCAACAVHRDHRYQRQVDDDGAGRASFEERELRRAARRQYWHRDPLARAARAGTRACDRVLVIPDRPRAFARSVHRHSAQCHRGPSRSPRHDCRICGNQGTARRRRAARRHRDRRRRRQLVPGCGRIASAAPASASSASRYAAP